MGLPQATKRLLPDFIIPFCVIRLDHVVEASNNACNTGIEQTCAALGCLDPRTARKHLLRIEWAADTVALSLAESIAAVPELSPLPLVTPELAPLQRCTLLIDRQNLAMIRAGSAALAICLRYLLQAALWNVCRKKPMTYVSDPSPPP
jgi:hypothetical protein